jgi:hypothetical protein
MLPRARLPGHPTPIGDPTSTHDESRRGGAGGGQDPDALAELATIVDVFADTYTYNVKTESGRRHEGLRRMRMHPADMGLLSNGTTVCVRYDLPTPYIFGVLDMPAANGSSFGPGASAGIGITGTTGFGGQGLSAAPGGGVVGGANARATNEPTDLIPGDLAFAHPSGSRVGALEGGLAVLVGSFMAQIRAYGLGDLVEIISRNFRHVTDFGVFEVKNREGKVGLSFRGGTDQLTESGKDEEKWTVRFDLGAEADLLDFRLTTPTGENLFHVHIDGDGRCNVYAADGFVTRRGSSSTERAVEETAGSVATRIGGDEEHSVEGARATATGRDARHAVGGTWDTSATADALLTAGRDLTLGAGRRAVLDAQGDSASSDPALELRARNGDMLLEAGHAPRPQSKIRMKTRKGAIELKSSEGGNITIETLLGELRASVKKARIKTQGNDSLILGGDAIVGHVTIFEQLERVILHIATTFDVHTHPGTGAPPTVQMSPAIRAMLPNAKSKIVGVSG